MSMRIKVSFGNDTRLWRSSKVPPRYEELDTFIVAQWGTLSDRVVQYKDDEGDMISITCQQDLEDALQTAKELGCKSLKMVVICSEYFGAVSQPAGTPPTKRARVEATTRGVVKTAVPARAAPMSTDEDMKECTEPSEPMPTDSLHAAKEDFMKQAADKTSDLAKELDEAVTIYFRSIKEGDTPQTALDMILASCDTLRQHKMIEHIRPFIYGYTEKLQHMTPVLLMIGPEAVRSNMRTVLGALHQMMKKGGA